MIRTLFQIKNPFAKDRPCSFNWHKSGKLTKHKSWEMQIWKGSIYELFSFELDFGWRGSDHSGVTFSVSVLGFESTIKLYDNRHWDYKQGTWINSNNLINASFKDTGKQK